MMLKSTFSLAKWRALILLVAGVILFVLPTIDVKEKNGISRTEIQPSTMDTLLGCGLEFVVVTISGFCSVYFEKAIKTDAEQVGIWERNFQLACWSIPSYLVMIVLSGGGEQGYFQGWTPLAFMLTLFGCSGGLLVALSIKYGDSVLKTLAISGSIIYAAVFDHFFLGGPLTLDMVVAAVVVIIAIFNYTFDSTPVPTADAQTQKLSSYMMANGDIESSDRGEARNGSEKKPFLSVSTVMR